MDMCYFKLLPPTTGVFEQSDMKFGTVIDLHVLRNMRYLEFSKNQNCRENWGHFN